MKYGKPPSSLCTRVVWADAAQVLRRESLLAFCGYRCIAFYGCPGHVGYIIQ